MPGKWIRIHHGPHVLRIAAYAYARAGSKRVPLRAFFTRHCDVAIANRTPSPSPPCDPPYPHVDGVGSQNLLQESIIIRCGGVHGPRCWWTVYEGPGRK